VPVLTISARHGLGVDELTQQIATKVAQKKVARKRLEADLKAVAGHLQDVSGLAKPKDVSGTAIAELHEALAESAGVPTVVEAVEKSTRLRAGRATGWPITSWVSRLRPDPLKRLHLDLGAAGKQLTGTNRTSMPVASSVQRARVDTAVRTLADEMSEGLTRPWQTSLRKASTSRLDDLGDRLDASLSSTDLGVGRLPVWAKLVRVLQWLLILCALGGALWLGALAGASYLQLDLADAPESGGLPVPTLMLLGGVAAGVVLAVLCRLLVGLTARSRARSADQRLRKGLHDVAEELVVAPLEQELVAYRQVRDGLAKALA